MEKQRPKISVIIPVYNVSEYIEQCLKSVVTQSFKDVEIICVDDCGNDDSVSKIENIRDERIKLIRHSENKGLACSRNTGLDNACGEYIFFLDSDDYLEAGVLENLYNSIVQVNADVAFSRGIAFTNDTDNASLQRVEMINKWLKYPVRKSFRIEEYNFEDVLDSLCCVAWGKLYSANFLRKNNIRFIEQNVIHEDNGFFIKLCSKFPVCTLTDYIGVYYRIRQNAITSGINQKIKKHKSAVHMKKCVNDAIEFIQAENDANNSLLLVNKIKNTNAYSNCFTKHFGFLCNFKWARDDKKVSVFGLTVFREKRINENKKCGKFFGLKLYKTKILPERIKLSIDKKELEKRFNKTSTKVVFYQNGDSNIKAALDKFGYFYFLPNKGNGGDVMINYAAFQYLETNNYNYDVFDMTNSHKYDKPFNFVYSGGAIWIENYKDCYQEILKIFKSPLLNKCVILPSSFRNCPDLMELLDERFTVFCREQVSYDYCKSVNSRAKFILANDMVIGANFDIFKMNYSNLKYLQSFIQNNDDYFKYISDKIYPFYQDCTIKAKKALQNVSDFKIGYLMRVDSEKAVSGLDFPNAFDLSDLMGTYCCDEGLDYSIGKLFLFVINKFKVIVTDRLHVAICAAKLGKEVLMFDNSYGKLRAVYNHSLKELTNMRFTSIDTLEQDISEALDRISTQNSEITLPDNMYDFLIEYGSFQNKYGCEKCFW